MLLTRRPSAASSTVSRIRLVRVPSVLAEAIQRSTLRRVDGGSGVLVLPDLFGATPSNLAARVARLGTPVRRVSAVSLPMLLRVMNYADLGLDDLPAIAAAGTRNGVRHDDG